MEGELLSICACKMGEKSSLGAYLTGRERFAKRLPLLFLRVMFSKD